MVYGVWAQKLPSLLEDVFLCHDCSAVFRLCSHSCECSLQLFPMPMVRRETDLDICLLLHDIDGAEHDALDKAVHRKAFHFRSPERNVFHSVCQDKGCCIEKQPEVVCTIGVTRHAVCLEILQILYPQFHLTTSAIAPVDGLR